MNHGESFNSDDNKLGSHKRRQSRKQKQFEYMMGLWYGDELAPMEIEKSHKKPKTIQDVANFTIRKALKDPQMQMMQNLRQKWLQIVGANFENKSAPQKLEFNILYIEADPITCFQMNAIVQKQILENVQKFFSEKVKQVRVVPKGRN